MVRAREKGEGCKLQRYDTQTGMDSISSYKVMVEHLNF